MPLGPNYNYDLEKQNLDRRQALLDALQQANLRPLELPTAGPGQVQAKLGPANILAQMAGAVANSYSRSQLQADQQALSDRYKSDLIQGMQDFYGKSAGGWKQTPGQEEVPSIGGLDDNGKPIVNNPQPAKTAGWDYTPPDMKGAIIQALASNNPMVQQLGQAGLATMYRNDPMSQLLGTGASQAGPTPPPDVLQSGAYTVNGQPAAAAAQPPVGGSAQSGAPGPGASIDAKLAYYFPNVDPVQARAMYASDPTGKTLAEENAHRGRIVVAGNNVFVPTGPGSVAVPSGALNAIKAVEQAKADVTNANTFAQDQQDPNTGAKITRTMQQALDLTGGGSGFKGQDLLMQMPPDERAKVMMAAITNGLQNFGVDFTLPDGRKVQGEVDLGQRGSGGTGYQSGQSPSLAAEQKAYGEGLAQQRAKIDQDAESALAVKARVNEMRDASQNFQSGALIPMREKLGGIAIALGMDPKDVDQRLGSISSMQMFNKEATQLAFDMVKSLGSREAAAVVTQAVRSNANWENQPQANKGMMDVIEGMADWKLAKQQAASAWADSHNGSLNGFETYFNKTSPITNFIKQTAAASPMPMGGPAPAAAGPGRVAPGAPKAIPFDEYLKQHGVR